MHLESSRDAQRKQFFNDGAHGWTDRNYSRAKLQKLETMLAGLALSQGMTLVDVGCGQGVLLPFLRLAVGESGTLIALDPSPEMLASVPERDARAVPLLARAEHIPLPAAYADMILCFSAFPHIGDKKAAAREFYRVLKPGGQAYVLHIDGREKLNTLHDQHHAVQGDHLPCPQGMRHIFGAAGFNAMTVDDAPDHYYFFTQK
ncbi:MAG: class I SAM-dependent methyltransferase [Desulfovibrionaceae bacterium]